MPVFQASRSGLVCRFVGCVNVVVPLVGTRGVVCVGVGVGCGGWVFRRASACVTSSGPLPTWTTCPSAFTDGVPASSTICFDIVGEDVVVSLELSGEAGG